MATYTVTTLNWNDPAFWLAINQSGPGHTIDFSGLPSSFDVDFWPAGDRIVICDGATNFTIGDSDYGGKSNAQMGGSTQLDYFTTIVGSQGSDTNDGGVNDDTIEGGAGEDVLTGNGGADVLYGDAGDDTLAGFDGNDTLYGGSGDDRLFGGTGTNWLDGGAGADTLDGNGGGYDTATYQGSTSGVTVDLSDGTTETGGDAQGDSLIGIEQVDGSEFADRLTANNSGMELQGRGGDDTLTGGTGDDVLLGGAGDDTVYGGSGNDQVNAGSGDDNVYGWLGNDTITGGAGDDQIWGEWGDDSLVGGSGNDSFYDLEGTDYMSGGDDADYFGYYDNGFGIGTDTIVGGEGGADQDTINFASWNTSINVTYTSNETGTITDGTDTITFSEVENLTLTDQDDLVDASASWDGITGDNVGESIDGRGGDDTITGGNGSDTIDGGTGNDLIDGDYGDDSLLGGDGADTLTGESGNDTIDGGAGDDSVTGGDGNDTFTYTPGDGSDTVTDFNTGNTGTLDDSDSTNNDFIDLSGFYDSIFELHADQADDGVLNQSNTTGPEAVDYSDNDQFASGEGITFTSATADNSSFTSENTGVVCFTTGTAIRTPRGDVLIDDLKVGDLVTTMDDGPQRIAWIGQRHVTNSELLQNERLHPVLIKQGVLGAERNLLVSRQHGMLLGQYHFGRAVHLAKTIPGIRIAAGKKQVTYIHLMFEAHQILFAEGIPSESFYPGPMALEMLSNASREEMRMVFPKLNAPIQREDIIEVYGATVRVFLENKKAVGTWLSESTDSVKKATKKWDVDLAMERCEAERMFGTKSTERIHNKVRRVA